MLDKLTHEVFQPLVGQKFALVSGEHEYAFQLIDVEELPVGGRKRRGAPEPKRRPFSIVFVAEPLLPQGMYPMKHAVFGNDSLPIFIVPIGKADGGYEYEAIFT